MVGKILVSLAAVLVLSVGIGSAATHAHSVTARNGLIAFAYPYSCPRITLVRPDGTGIRYATKWGCDCPGPRCGGNEPAFSPDGHKLVYVKHYSEVGISVIDLVTNRVTRVTRNQGYQSGPSWSPDGRQIVFSEAERLTVVTIGSGARRIIYTTTGYAWGPSWSPDGASIAFTSNATQGEDVPGQIATIRTSGRGLRRLTVEGDNYSPDWSPDGRRLAYINTVDGVRRLMTMRRDGSDKRVVKRLDGPDCPQSGGVAWSPDGRKFATVVCRRIATLNVDGSGLRLLMRGAGQLDWQPIP